MRAVLPCSLFLVALVGCTSPGPLPTASKPDAVQAAVQTLLDRAQAEEPALTPMLKDLATRGGGELYKLQYRLKGRDSAIRKMRKHLAKHPGAKALDVELQDMLRYTMKVEDTPSGNYVRTAHATLQFLEAQGHTVDKVKNSWPRGDSYSGVNTVLRTPSGLPWELQFHTSASLKAQADTRRLYEELRSTKTSAARKRELFDLMAAVWQAVPLPEGILEPHNLHAKEEPRLYPRP